MSIQINLYCTSILCTISHVRNLHVNRFIDDNVILNRHSGEGHNFSAVPIDSTHMCDPKHHQFLILVNVKLFSKIIGMVRHWIGKSVSSCTTMMVMSRIYPL